MKSKYDLDENNKLNEIEISEDDHEEEFEKNKNEIKYSQSIIINFRNNELAELDPVQIKTKTSGRLLV